MLCRLFLTDFGAGCRNRTCFVSLKRRVHSHICQSRALKPGERTVSAVARELSRGRSSEASLCPLINGGGYRSRTCLAALIWRQSAYKALPLPEDPLKQNLQNFGPSGMNRTSVGRI